MILLLATSFFGMLTACDTAATTFPETCELPALVPESTALPGDAVWADGRAMTSVNDTVVTVGSSVATVLDVERTGCDDRDTCRTDNACNACADCDECAAETAACVERVRFTVPADVASGDQVITLRNGYGTTQNGTLTVLAQDAGDDTADTAR